MKRLAVLLFYIFSLQLALPVHAQDIWVADGDTIHIDGQPIRFLGIDAPEGGQTCRDAVGHPYDCGQVARRALIRILKAGAVSCSDEGHDKYGRTLSHCRAGDLDVNEAMVARGFARAFVHFSSEYLANEQEAQAAHRGFWAGTWDAPWDWRMEHPKRNP